MMAIMVAEAVAVEVNSVEESMETNLATEAVDAEDKVANAKVVTVAMKRKDMMKTRESTLTWTFHAS